MNRNIGAPIIPSRDIPDSNYLQFTTDPCEQVVPHDSCGESDTVSSIRVNPNTCLSALNKLARARSVILEHKVTSLECSYITIK